MSNGSEQKKHHADRVRCKQPGFARGWLLKVGGGLERDSESVKGDPVVHLILPVMEAFKGAIYRKAAWSHQGVHSSDCMGNDCRKANLEASGLLGGCCCGQH